MLNLHPDASLLLTTHGSGVILQGKVDWNLSPSYSLYSTSNPDESQIIRNPGTREPGAAIFVSLLMGNGLSATLYIASDAIEEHNKLHPLKM
jgi:hypothetical protein